MDEPDLPAKSEEEDDGYDEKSMWRLLRHVSELGQKRRFGRRPVYPNQRTFTVLAGMSQMCP